MTTPPASHAPVGKRHRTTPASPHRPVSSLAVPGRSLAELTTKLVGPLTSPYAVPGVATCIRGFDGHHESSVVGADADGTPLTSDTIFALGSSTKLATGLAVLRLVDEGRLALDASVGAYVPTAAAAHPDVTIRRLLSHTAGLPLDLPADEVPYTHRLTADVVLDACLAVAPVRPPGQSVSYSNVGFGLLGRVVEILTGDRFQHALRRLVLDPLGVDAWIGDEPPRRPASIADVNSRHAGTDLEPFNSRQWRSLALPWAGLYATIDGYLRLLEAYDVATDACLVSAERLQEARRDQTAGLAGGFPSGEAFLGFEPGRGIEWSRCAWGLALEVRGEKRPHWTSGAVAPTSYGQIGSSGCVAWCDPVAGVRWAVIGTRTTDSGWLLRHGPAISQYAVRHVAARRTNSATP